MVPRQTGHFNYHENTDGSIALSQLTQAQPPLSSTEVTGTIHTE